ncbi:hypothetical protein F5884DRAFT_779523 [Xylogone sp. PMI_703]|nr:hypothetical protein F5884DRAFT_779523 [Xylogone sp. PMI_703]
MVSADLEDKESLIRAFKDATAIFAVTDFYETFRRTDPWTAMETEHRHGINLARAAIQTPTLEHYIWSTLPSVYKTSEKKFFVFHYEAKARVNEFIKSNPVLSAKTTFLWLGFFESNFQNPGFAPIYDKMLDRYILQLPTPPTTLFWMMGDSNINTGLFVRGILNRPDISLPGKYVLGNVETLSISEYLQRWSTSTGRKARYVQIAPEDYCRLYPPYGTEMYPMFQYLAEYGEKPWPGDHLVTSKDLQIESELVGLEQTWSSMDLVRKS